MGRGKPVLSRGQIREKMPLLGERDILILDCLYAWNVSLGLIKKLYIQREAYFEIWSFQVFAESWVLNTCHLNAQAFLMPASAHISTFPSVTHSMIACAPMCQ